MKTARFFAEQLHRLDAVGIKTFILRGNHDALSKITKELVFPDSVMTFGGRAQAITLDRASALPEIVIHGLSFSDPKAPDSLLPKYRTPMPNAVNIGMMHTSLNGAPGHDPYAPCGVADLDASGFSYWALGHIHKRATYIGASTVVMPGNPQGRDINESGQKSVSLVTVADDGMISIEERNVSIAQFERLTLDVADVGDWRDLIMEAAQALSKLRSTVTTEHLIFRLRLVGTSPLAWTIRRDIDLLQQEIEMQAEVIGASWLEKIELQFDTWPVADAASADTVMELRQIIVDKVGAADGFRTQMDEFAGELIKGLPPELRNLLGADEGQRFEILEALMREGTDDVLARLRGTVSNGAAV